METRTVLFIAGAGLLGVGAFMAATPASASISPAPEPNPEGCTPETNLCTGSPLVTKTPSQCAPSNPAARTLAQTAWGEARGEGTQGMQAVLNVIMNRVRAGNFPGGTNPAAVATARNQFSAWNANDPNRVKMSAVTTSDPQYVSAMALALRALDGTLPDLTGGAVYYHESSIPTPKSWGQVAETTQIGNHIFYVRG